ncbi:MAG: GH92 family glycosyl hydrolase [Bacteroides sp.]|nr:GH92 family glycosyl hydrolase [Bacteroides sp.]MDD4055726.1 GH92 family glycosyl hydrolase [Bacteroides sp.]
MTILFPVFIYGNTTTKTPVDYVNPYIGNISHLLVPTFPTIHLPNSMVRVYPERENFTSNRISGLPLIVTSHRGASAFNLSPFDGELENVGGVLNYGYDNEIIKPYYYQVDLDDYGIEVKYAPSHQAGMYVINFDKKNINSCPHLIFNTRDGEIKVEGRTISGYQELQNNTRVFIFLETDIEPVAVGTSVAGGIDTTKKLTSGKNAHFVLRFSESDKQIKVRYGVSLISEEQAKKNLRREINHYDLDRLIQVGRELWNSTLGKINIEGDAEDEKTVFYTSLYRTYERMICISEDGQYFSAYDNQIHDDKGEPFYVDDWIWDTYRATHPLRVIIEPEMEVNMINSFIRMAEQMDNFWMPTFPEVTGDSRRMNSNHGVATVIDAYKKGLRGFDLEKAYEACKNAITEKTLAPWSSKPAGELDHFYKEKGYFPALAQGEKETIPEVHNWEKRQPIAVTLGTVYDEWCLAQIAKELGEVDDYNYFIERSKNYRKVFNRETGFFHPKDQQGSFIEPFDYRFSGGLGARHAYDENNGWVYRWDVPHNVADLIELLGGKEKFVQGLEDMFSEPLGKSRYEFYANLPDHTGNVGQFSMGNEPSMHIPYLYNYAGEPWRTQKRVYNLLKQWFRNDLMGIPGDEDGGGLTSFVVFSQLGFYPVTPGLPMYVIGTPRFEKVTMQIGKGKSFEIVCLNYSPEHKYIQSARLNGEVWNKSWFSHDDLMKGGKLELVMGKKPNKHWASSEDAIPPSFEMN